MCKKIKVASVWTGFEPPDITNSRGFIGTCIPISPEYALTDRHVIGDFVTNTKFYILIQDQKEFIEVQPLPASKDYDVILLKSERGTFPIEYYPELLSMKCSDYYSYLKDAYLETKGFPAKYSEEKNGIEWEPWKEFSFLTSPKEHQDGYPTEFQFEGGIVKGCSGSPLFVKSKGKKKYLIGLFTHGGDKDRRAGTCTALAIDPILNYLTWLFDNKLLSSRFSPIMIDRVDVIKKKSKDRNMGGLKQKNIVWGDIVRVKKVHIGDKKYNPDEDYDVKGVVYGDVKNVGEFRLGDG